MVRASVRFLLFTRRAAIIEIWVEHDTEPKGVKSTKKTSLSLVSFSFLSPHPNAAPLPGPCGRSSLKST